MPEREQPIKVAKDIEGGTIASQITLNPQCSNAYCPIVVTLLGITIDLNLRQPEKAQPSMLVTLLPIVTEIKPLQPEKAPPPMLVTLLGIVTEAKPLQL